MPYNLRAHIHNLSRGVISLLERLEGSSGFQEPVFQDARKQNCQSLVLEIRALSLLAYSVGQRPLSSSRFQRRRPCCLWESAGELQTCFYLPHYWTKSLSFSFFLHEVYLYLLLQKQQLGYTGMFRALRDLMFSVTNFIVISWFYCSFCLDNIFIL